MDTETIALSEAKAKGLERYIGKPCPRGHGGQRYVVSLHCCECSAALTDRYKAWVREPQQTAIHSRLNTTSSKLKHVRISAKTEATIGELRSSYAKIMGRSVTMTLLVCRALDVVAEYVTGLDAIGIERERQAVMAMSLKP